MPAAKTTVKSSARSERAKALIASLPRDASGRIQKRPGLGASAPPTGTVPPTLPAGGPVSTPPFVQAPRGTRHFMRPRSGSPR